MTLILSFRGPDGVALLADRRKWWRHPPGSFEDDCQKLAAGIDCLVVGYGNGELLDDVTEKVPGNSVTQVFELLRDAQSTASKACESVCWFVTSDVPEGESPSFQVWDGCSLKPILRPTNVPEMPKATFNAMKLLWDQAWNQNWSWNRKKRAAVRIYRMAYEARVVGPEFDLGIHRVGEAPSVERLTVAIQTKD